MIRNRGSGALSGKIDDPPEHHEERGGSDGQLAVEFRRRGGPCGKLSRGWFRGLHVALPGAAL
jgi:hypothetical protein